MKEKIKICCVASSGGHWVELTALRDVYLKYNYFFVTESGAQADETDCKKVYQVAKISRKDSFFLIKFFWMWIKALNVIIKERPNVILSTGALISVPYCFLGKFFGGKIVYIESFARTEKPSLTGRIVYPIADLFIVQWKSLCKFYPKAVYGGKVF